MNAYAALQRLIDRELWLVTASHGGRRGGLISTNVTEVSIVPEQPRVLVGISKQHFTWELIEGRRAFAMHLLAEEHLDWVIRFGTQSGRDRDKFAGIATSEAPTGSPILDGAVGWLDCRVEASLDTGDRTVYLGEVVEAKLVDARPVLTAKRMIELVPESIRNEMKTQRDQDARIDADAIRSWRLTCRGGLSHGLQPPSSDPQGGSGKAGATQIMHAAQE
jgi:flavin reductase (DIM6/NTAB) family NADH-FMN oxidoreductase RutF